MAKLNMAAPHAAHRDTLVMSNDLVCFSHLRWGFVYQRPQHLLSRFANNQRVFFVEEPIYDEASPRLAVDVCAESGVHIVVPHLPGGLSQSTQETIQRLLLTNFIAEYAIENFTAWYYTPMALAISRHLSPQVTVFDCMDELSAFKNAPQEMKDREQELLTRADVVFTGGMSLYEGKLGRHSNLHCFPSSIDYDHFAQARTITEEPEDQAAIPGPRIGFAGVIDERMNLELLEGIATARPHYHFVIVGPVVKISPDSLPKLPNIHYLGGKSYKDLPSYLAGWSVAILPFAHNESTRFISPTKTPEYLAAGKPVVSTSITDVVRPYGIEKAVRIADTVEEFATAIDNCLEIDSQSPEWRARVESLLATNSWDLTWKRMSALIANARRARSIPKLPMHVAASELRQAANGD